MFPVNTYHEYFGTTFDVLTTYCSYLIDIKENEFFRAPKITQNQDKNHELGLADGPSFLCLFLLLKPPVLR